jgi:hypothetical protein
MPDTYLWIGRIWRDGDGLVGILTDNGPGYSIELKGERTPGGYRLVGTPGPVPEQYEIPWLDKPAAKSS